MKQCIKPVTRLGMLLVLWTVCAGCSIAPKVQSVKAPDYNKMPQSILVFLPKGFTTMTSNGVVLPGAGEAHMGEGFDEVFSHFTSQCNITAHTNLGEKDLKQQTVMAQIAATNPDWIMTIEPTKADTIQQTMYGVPQGLPQVTAINYNVTVIDHAANTKVWRANVNVLMGKNWIMGDDDKQPGRNTALAIIKQIRADGLLTTCPVLAE